MIQKFSQYLVGIAVLTALLLTGCSGLQQKIDAAERAIKESEKINANKYAPDKLNRAKDHLSMAKTQAKSDKKKAEKNADDAKERADEAYAEALNEFIISQRRTTKEKMDAANASYAEINSQEKYDDAMKLTEGVNKDIEDLENLSRKLKELENKK